MLKALTPHPIGFVVPTASAFGSCGPLAKARSVLKAAIVTVTVGETSDMPVDYRDSHNIVHSASLARPLHTPAMHHVDTHDFESPHSEKIQPD